jgi:hypothetical protein
MYFHPARVAWISWSLIWAAGWAMVAAVSAPRHLCAAVLVYTSNGQQCMAPMPTGNLGLMVSSAVLALASVAVAFIPVHPAKIRRHLFAGHSADPG